MKFFQMHERLRTELLRRIQRGTLSVSLLARKTGFGRAHLSNFLHNRGRLSMDALDSLLTAQHLEAEDLLEPGVRGFAADAAETPDVVPLVSHNAALFEPIISPSLVHMKLQLPPGALHSIHRKAVASRRSWDRFVAIRVAREDADPMEPLLYPNAIAVIDRHYNSLIPHRPSRPNIYAVRSRGRITLRYVDSGEMCLALRARDPLTPAEMIEIAPETSVGQLIVGRVALIFNEV